MSTASHVKRSALGRRGISLLAVAALGAGTLALASPAQSAPPALSAPEILGGQVSSSGGGSLTGSDPFNKAAYATVAGPASIVEPTFTVRWNYSNSDPRSAATNIIASTPGRYECPTATFNPGACSYRANSTTTEGGRYATADTFLATISGATAGTYVFPILTITMNSGAKLESRATSGSLVTAPIPSVNPPGVSPGADEAAKTLPLATANGGEVAVSFQSWTGVGTRTPSRTVRVFDCAQPFESAVPPAQPTGCTAVLTQATGADTSSANVAITHTWAADRYLVATDTLALASAGLLTAHERAASYRIVDAGAVDPTATGDPNADPNAPGGAGNAGGGTAGGGNPGGGAVGGGNTGGVSDGTVDPGGSALIGIDPEVAPLVSENGVGIRNAVTLTLRAPKKAGRGVKKLYRAVLAPTTQAGKVVFTIARPKADGTLQVLKKASAKVKAGKANKRISIPRAVPRGQVRVFASYLPRPRSAAGMTVSKAMLLR